MPSDTRARAERAISFARRYAAGVIGDGDGSGYHPEYRRGLVHSGVVDMIELAAAGLALRAAAMHPRDGAALGIVGSVTPQSALDAYDAAIRAALGTDADAGDVAGEAQ